MGPRFIANEMELYERFIESEDEFPRELQTRGSSHVFVWAYRLPIHDAGIRGGNGEADIVIVDESGLPWIIEAKIRSSNELNHRVWEQLVRYRDSLAKMKWEAVHDYAASWLHGRKGLKPPERVREQLKHAEHLVEAIGVWQREIGRAQRKAKDIVAAISEHLESRTVGLVVVADAQPSKELLAAAKALDHSGPIAYLRALPKQKGKLAMDATVLKAVSKPNPAPAAGSSKRFYRRFRGYTERLQGYHCTPDSLQDGLCKPARGLWTDVLKPGLVNLGWDTTDGNISRRPKSISVGFDVGDYPLELLRIGWSDTNASGIKRARKRPGAYSMKLEFFMTDAWNDGFLERDEAEEWAGRFYKLGWRGIRYPAVGKRRLTENEWDSWLMGMKYKPSKRAQDFSGRKKDAQVLKDFLHLLGDFLEEMRGKC